MKNHIILCWYNDKQANNQIVEMEKNGFVPISVGYGYSSGTTLFKKESLPRRNKLEEK